MAQARKLPSNATLKLAVEYLNSHRSKVTSNNPPQWRVDEKEGYISVSCLPSGYIQCNPCNPNAQAEATEGANQENDLFASLNDAAAICTKEAIVNITQGKYASPHHAIADKKAIDLINQKGANEVLEQLKKMTGFTWKILPDDTQVFHFRYSSPEVDTEQNKDKTVKVRAAIDSVLASNFPELPIYKVLSADQRKGRVVKYGDLLAALNKKATKDKIAAATPQVPNSGTPAPGR